MVKSCMELWTEVGADGDRALLFDIIAFIAPHDPCSYAIPASLKAVTWWPLSLSFVCTYCLTNQMAAVNVLLHSVA